MENISWKQQWNERSFRMQFLFTFSLLAVLLFSLSYFFAYIQARPSHIVNDVILNLAEPVDVSLFTFLIIYSTAIYTIIVVMGRPWLFLKAVQAYAIMLFIRLVTLYFVPLEPPRGIIPLHDPFIEQLFYGQTRLTKDLFFSGHVATVTLLFLVNPNEKLSWMYATVVVLVAVLILWQRVHYSFDVLAAPVFAWLSWKLANKIMPSINRNFQ